MENGKIPFHSLSHNTIEDSSKLNATRLNTVSEDLQFGLYSSDASKEEWLQIDLGSKHKVRSLKCDFKPYKTCM